MDRLGFAEVADRNDSVKIYDSTLTLYVVLDACFCGARGVWIRSFSEAMVHFDGTARHQSVGHKDEPWIHELLLAVGKHTGLAALINTSFNTKGAWLVSWNANDYPKVKS